MKKRLWMAVPVVLLAVLAACGTPGVTPQNNDNGNDNTDTTVPTLTSSIPSNGISSVAINNGIQLVFSEKIPLPVKPKRTAGSSITPRAWKEEIV